MGPGAHPWAEKGTEKEKVRMKEKQTWRRVLPKLEKEKEQSLSLIHISEPTRLS